MKVRSLLYRAARLLGDVNAIRRGPKAMAKRWVGKAAGRKYGSVLNKLIR